MFEIREFIWIKNAQFKNLKNLNFMYTAYHY